MSHSDTSALPQLWSSVETSLGVIAACIPSLAPLFIVVLGKLPTIYRAYKPCYDSAKSPTGRSHRTTKGQFNRMANIVESNPRSQSLELIMQHAKGGSSEQGNEAEPRALENEIVVIQQIDQVSRERLGDREAENLGVDTRAET